MIGFPCRENRPEVVARGIEEEVWAESIVSLANELGPALVDNRGLLNDDESVGESRITQQLEEEVGSVPWDGSAQTKKTDGL